VIAWLERAEPHRLAVEAPEGSLTYRELLAAARSARPDGRLAMPPGLEFAVALHAHLLQGVTAVPVDPRLRERERAALARPAGEGEGALVVHTSGTTGAPRPVVLTAANIEASARASGEVLGLTPEDRWLCPLPLSHVGGLMVLLRAAIFGFTAVIGGLDRLGDATFASLVPTQLARAIDAGRRGGAQVVLGGAGAPRALLERAREAGVPVRQTYGLTQTCSMVTLSEPGDLQTCGPPVPGAELEIAPGGEILVRGPMVAGGGLLRTGDLGRLEGGRLVVTGRISDVIVTGGENVAPAEVEAVLLEHPDVADAAVFARPHPEWGEAVTARIVPRAGAAPDAADLRGFCAERLAGFKVPKEFELGADPLPRTPSGKLLRRELG
jgi:O-succinylbenzoic acid--CoA ligase